MRHIAAIIATWLAGVGLALACNVPVYRYAIERWPSDPFRIVIYHRGPLGAEDAAKVAALETLLSSVADEDSAKSLEKPPVAGKVDLSTANATIELVDLAAEPADDRPDKLDDAALAALPWVEVRFPEATHVKIPVWRGPLKSFAAESLLDSPVRQEVAKRLLAGQTAVWLFLPVGDQAKDADARKQLAESLKGLAKTLKLPELSDDPADRLSAEAPPLGIEFSLLDLNRDDPREQALVQMLLASEEDLAELKEPMAFPVYGRGRALYALVGGGIIEENIQTAGGFLVGPCSCEVKRLNPGVDLLMAVNWDVFGPPVERPSLVGKVIPLPPPVKEEDLVGTAAVEAPIAVVAAKPVTAEYAHEAQAPASTQSLKLAIAAAAVLVAITGIWAIQSSRRTASGASTAAAASSPAQQDIKS